MKVYHEHFPVMLHECMDALITDENGIYIDGTLGGGGHAKEILALIGPEATLYGVDQDDEAHAAAKARIGDDPRFIPVKGNFGYLTTLLPPQAIGQVSGILLDLGVSTHQIKEAERGFSFQEDGPLDMRMGNLSGVSAYQVVNNYEYEALRDVFFLFGEETWKQAKLPKPIIDARPIDTTGQLAKVIKGVVSPKFAIKSWARIFPGNTKLK